MENRWNMERLLPGGYPSLATMRPKSMEGKQKMTKAIDKSIS
jgi:hypothetical protein